MVGFLYKNLIEKNIASKSFNKFAKRQITFSFHSNFGSCLLVLSLYLLYDRLYRRKKCFSEITSGFYIGHWLLCFNKGHASFNRAICRVYRNRDCKLFFEICLWSLFVGKEMFLQCIIPKPLSLRKIFYVQLTRQHKNRDSSANIPHCLPMSGIS